MGILIMEIFIALEELVRSKDDRRRTSVGYLSRLRGISFNYSLITLKARALLQRAIIILPC